MSQVLEEIKTFWIAMTRNGDIEYIKEDRNVMQEVEKIIAKEPGYTKQLEKTVGKANISLDEKESFVEKAEISESLANKRADEVREQKEKLRDKDKGERVREQ